MTRAEELVRLLALAQSYHDETEGRQRITGLEHALRCATLAQIHGQELTFIALVHDLARPLSPLFHGEVMAEIVRDRVSDAAYHVLRTHGSYQDSLLNGTVTDIDVPWHWDAMRFAAIEQRSFNEYEFHGIDDAASSNRIRSADLITEVLNG